MSYVEFITTVHTSTKRDYLARVTENDKAACAEVALKYDSDYWDGERCYGYGGYRYDGRWRPVAQRIASHYGLKAGQRVLDVGCGKGFLIYELTQVVPGLEVSGIDISNYALSTAHEAIRPFLSQGNAVSLQFEDQSFDLVISLNTLHNLFVYDLKRAFQEIERVGKGKGYVVVESYRNEREKVNLLYWQLTCRAFMTPDEWKWFMQESGYSGDYEFIFFE